MHNSFLEFFRYYLLYDESIWICVFIRKIVWHDEEKIYIHLQQNLTTVLAFFYNTSISKNLPFVILMRNKEFIELLSLKLKFIIVIFFDGFTIGYIVVLGGEERLEGHHRRLLTLSLSDGLRISEEITSLNEKSVCVSNARNILRLNNKQNLRWKSCKHKRINNNTNNIMKHGRKVVQMIIYFR